jgi:hypothetical protein
LQGNPLRSEHDHEITKSQIPLLQQMCSLYT